ncbi:acyl-CoA/acyl-ACP dehydrogenase [Amycolatopsis sp. OK19-0408]|uniref:Acyl-CoA/acyl-ACP dehydrogenase n=1 Tax=Amycolatopsis iheyensis TaxID=2945988 RepID=A0A9X2NAK2_9PSEU|nr:acyl-CoA dehydrogenase family protein [Amycolatopsis iheyensis]MCR6485206.1 acyl-CoA/acyl-ACP dehydrogenase [Amycolatopsis iheyensis]
MTDPLETEESQALRSTVRTLLTRRSAVRTAMESPLGYDDKLWSTLCEQIGVAGLAIPSQYGGLGAGLAEVCVVLGELGRTLTPAPMLGSAVLCGEALLRSGNHSACSRLLPGIAAGTTLAALAWSDPDWAPGLSVSSSGLDGRAHYVLDGDLADVLLAVARTSDGLGLFEVPLSGVRRSRVTTLDPTRRLAVVDFSSAPARRLDVSGFPLPLVLETAAVAVAAEQVGAASRALELTVEYAQQRRQFGRAIGSFQALKHRMADVHVHVEAARSALYAALVDGDSDAVSAARVVCGEAFSHAAAEMIQMHGGIAITWEHDAHLYFKRAHGSSLLFGPWPY